MMATSVQILPLDMNSGLSSMNIWRSPLDTKKLGQFIRDICLSTGDDVRILSQKNLPKSYAWGLALGKIPSNFCRNLRWILNMMVWKRCFLRNSLSGCNNVAISRRYPWHHCCGSIRVTWRKTERVNLAKHEVQMFQMAWIVKFKCRKSHRRFLHWSWWIAVFFGRNFTFSFQSDRIVSSQHPLPQKILDGEDGPLLSTTIFYWIIWIMILDIMGGSGTEMM